MVLTYLIRDSLHVNITNSCTNRHNFFETGGEGRDPSRLILEREPTKEEIVADVLSRDLTEVEQIVFSGYGEPTCRLYDMLAACREIKDACTGLPVGLVTNGHASMIFGEDTTSQFRGLVDRVSVSMMAPDSETYIKLCGPKFGEETYPGVLKFARDIARFVPEVVLTAVEGTISREDAERCRTIADGLGLPFEMKRA